MKTMRKKLTVIICFLVALIMLVTLFGCTAGGGDGWGGGFAGDMAPSGTAPDGSSDGSEGDVPDNPNGSQNVIKKQLTAAEWRDALDYDFWLGLFEKDIVAEGQEQTVRDGIFHGFAKATRGLDTFDMHEINVTCDGSPVVGAQVKLYDGNDLIYSAVSDSAGKAYVFGAGTRVEAVSGSVSAGAEVSGGVTDVNLAGFDACGDELEIMLVVDTTGSMDDELSFLCEELAGVVTRVSEALDCEIRLGLLFYRDAGDKYVTRKFDFVNVTSAEGLSAAVKNINAQTADGGGDYPEAVDTALSEAVAGDWHANSKTKLLFHVLDAPYHDEQENQGKFANAVTSAAQKGIRVIPVAASGLDTLGQYIMRSAALLTGGTYAFLTDDSGIGDSHELPAVGKFTVEYLSDLMVRLIKGYYTGIFETPILWTQSESVV